MSMENENINVNEEVKEEKEFTSEVKIAGDVIATIAGLAATEIEGIASMQGNLTNELVGKLGVKNLTKGVTIEFDEENTMTAEKKEIAWVKLDDFSF